MVSGLNVLLGKVGRPVVLNGKLLCSGKTPILISRPSYSREYHLAGNNTATVDGDALLLESVDTFTDRYISVAPGADPDLMKQINAPTLDTFTGAIVLETELFANMAKADMHDGTKQFPQGTALLLKEFVAEYVENWFESYLYLFNRRIAAQHMPFSVKGHFVAGLYQPLIVSTKQIPSPFHFGENLWLHDALKEYEEFLHLPGETDKRLTLSCVAMCDIAKVFDTPVMFELDRKLWVFLMVLMLMLRLNPNKSAALAKKYPRFFNRLVTSPRVALERQGRLLTPEEVDALSHRDYAVLFSHMTSYTQNESN